MSAATAFTLLPREEVEEDASFPDSSRSANCASAEALLKVTPASETPLISRRRPCLNIFTPIYTSLKPEDNLSSRCSLEYS